MEIFHITLHQDIDTDNCNDREIIIGISETWLTEGEEEKGKEIDKEEEEGDGGVQEENRIMCCDEDARIY